MTTTAITSCAHGHVLGNFAAIVLSDMFDVDRSWMERIRFDARLRRSSKQSLRSADACIAEHNGLGSSEYVRTRAAAAAEHAYALEDGLAVLARSRDRVLIGAAAAQCRGVAHSLFAMFRRHFSCASADVAAMLEGAKSGADVSGAIAFVKPYLVRHSDDQVLHALAVDGVHALADPDLSAMQCASITRCLTLYVRLTWNNNIVYRTPMISLLVLSSASAQEVTTLDAQHLRALRGMWQDVIVSRHLVMTRCLSAAGQEVAEHERHLTLCARVCAAVADVVRRRRAGPDVHGADLDMQDEQVLLPSLPRGEPDGTC